MTTKTTERDLIQEVEELLAKVGQWHPPKSVQGVEHALFADAVERQGGSPFWGYSKPVAQLYYHAPKLLRRLVGEVKSTHETLLALKNCQNKPVCGHCNALLRHATRGLDHA